MFIRRATSARNPFKSTTKQRPCSPGAVARNQAGCHAALVVVKDHTTTGGGDDLPLIRGGETVFDQPYIENPPESGPQ